MTNIENNTKINKINVDDSKNICRREDVGKYPNSSIYVYLYSISKRILAQGHKGGQGVPRKRENSPLKISTIIFYSLEINTPRKYPQ